MSDHPVKAAAMRVATSRAYVRKYLGRSKDEFVGHQPADEFDRDVDTVVAWVLQWIDGSTP